MNHISGVERRCLSLLVRWDRARRELEDSEERAAADVFQPLIDEALEEIVDLAQVVLDADYQDAEYLYSVRSAEAMALACVAGLEGLVRWTKEPEGGRGAM